MKDPFPVNLQTSAEVRKQGWQAESRDADGHLISCQAPIDPDDEGIAEWIVECTSRGETVTFWPIEGEVATQRTPPPSSHVAGDDAAWNSLLAAQNNVIDGLMAENELLFKALGQLELANDNVCGARPQKIYDAMLSAGISDRMTELDEARRIARATLADAGRARLATTEGKDNG